MSAPSPSPSHSPTPTLSPSISLSPPPSIVLSTHSAAAQKMGTQQLIPKGLASLSKASPAGVQSHSMGGLLGLDPTKRALRALSMVETGSFFSTGVGSGGGGTDQDESPGTLKRGLRSTSYRRAVVSGVEMEIPSVDPKTHRLSQPVDPKNHRLSQPVDPKSHRLSQPVDPKSHRLSQPVLKGLQEVKERPTSPGKKNKSPDKKPGLITQRTFDSEEEELYQNYQEKALHNDSDEDQSREAKPDDRIVMQYRPIRTSWSQLSVVKKSGVSDKLSQEERKRQEAIFELISSEHSYLHSLEVLIRMFQNSAELSDTMTKTEHHHLFSNITDVCEASKKFFKELEDIHQQNVVIDDISDIVFRHAQSNFDPYITYCSNEVYQQRTLQRLVSSKSPVFKEVLTRIEGHPDCRNLPMISFLILPMQRVTRLPLLMDVICQKAPKDSAQYETCKKALQSVSKVVRKCNEGARTMERTEMMYTINSQLDFKIKCVMTHCGPIEPPTWTRTTGRGPQDRDHRTGTTGQGPQDRDHRTRTTGQGPQDRDHRTGTTGHGPQDAVDHRTLWTTGRCGPQDAVDHRTGTTGQGPQGGPQGRDHRTRTTGHRPQDRDHRTGTTGRCGPQDAVDHRTLWTTGQGPQDRDHRGDHRGGTTGRGPQDRDHRTGTTGQGPQDADHMTGTTGRGPQDRDHRGDHRTGTTGRGPQDADHRTGTTGQGPQDRDHRTGTTGGTTGHGPQDTDPRTGTTGQGPQDRDHRTGITGRGPQDRDHRTGTTGRGLAADLDDPYITGHQGDNGRDDPDITGHRGDNGRDDPYITGHGGDNGRDDPDITDHQGDNGRDDPDITGHQGDNGRDDPYITGHLGDNGRDDPYITGHRGDNGRDDPYITDHQGDNGRDDPYITGHQGDDGRDDPYITGHQENDDVCLSHRNERARWISALGQSSNDEKNQDRTNAMQVEVTRTYTAKQPDELSLQVADVVLVSQTVEDGWYEGERLRDGERGWFLSECAEPIMCRATIERNMQRMDRLQGLETNV
ncbi:rho guanine nucleotide exchange factor 26-like [Salmo trutta]|uniref:rho guanine nucleotide exchange factor 26-like n=1 Tax=Salmo trutta TaxID=8032 RepID=UPI0011324BA4|nr:rho guanine nucleotide exchange factor 26 [Salmo trutta]